ncbi:filamin-A-like isoform X9 [Ptychodera flava]|uniref:filamin-A-like isoform X9 n=1 Tax=Ptychodera flava TaxID=63121 RepID=UPI00396A4479
MVIESDFATVEEPAVFEAGMVIEEEPSVNVVDKDDFNVDVKVVEDGESPSEMTSTRVSFVKRGLTSIGGRFSSMISRDKGSVQDQTQESTAEEPADIVLETDAANIQEAEIATDVNENERTSKTVTIVKRGFTKFGEKFQSMMKKDTSEIREQEELITVTEQPSIESAIEVDLQPEQSVVTVESDTAVVEETDVLETDTVIEEVPSGMIVEKEETISVEDGEITDGTSSRVSFVKRGLTTIGGKFQIMMSRDKKSNDDQVEEIAVVEEPPEIVLEKATINVQETENTLDVNASEETFTTVTMVKRGFTRFGEKFQSLMTKDTAEIEDKKEVITVVEEPRIESGIEVNIHAEPSVSTIESEMAMVEESDVLETDVVVEEPVEINIEKENFSVPELETQDTPSSPVTVIKSGFSKFGERFQSIITKGTTKTQTEEEVINVTEQPRFESGIEVNVQPEQSVTIVESDIVMVEEPDMLETEIVIEEEPSESIVEKDSVSVQESEVSDETSSKVSFVQRGLTTLGGKFQIMMSRDKGKKEDHVEEITAVEEPADTVLEKDDVDVQETEVSNDANASDVTSRTVTVVKRGLTEFKEKFQSMMTKETVTVVEEEDKEEVASFSVQPTIESGIEVNIEPEQSVTIVESDIVMVEEPDMLETEIVIEEEPSESIVEKDSVSVQESEVSDETSSKVSFVQRGLTTIGGKFQIMMSRDKGKKEAHVEEITAVEEPADTVLEKDDVDVHIEETEAGESVNTTTVTSRTVTVVKRGFTRFGEKFQSLMTKDTAGIEGEEEVISVSEEPRIESGIELNIQPEQSVSIVEGEFTLVEEPVAMETETLIEAEPSETTVEKDSISFQESEVSDETSSKVSFMQRGLTTIEERFHAMMSRNKDSRENQAEDITVTVVDEPTEIVLEKDTVNIQETEVTNDVNARTSSKVTIVKRGITKLEETFHSLIGKSATPAGQVQEEVIVAQGEPIIERTILTYSEPEDEDETDFTEKRTFKVSFSRNISAEEEEYWKVIEGDTISIDGMKSDVLVQEEDIVPSVRDYSEPTFAEPMAEYLNSTEMDHSFEMIQEDMVPERQNGVFSLPAYGRRNTPVRARVVPVFNPKKAYVTGRGIQPKGIRVREDAIFYVHTKEAGEAELRVQIIGPGGINEPAQIVSNKDGTYTVKYRPLKPGRYIINVTYGKEHVMKSPFTVNISPEAEPPLTYVKAYGPGLESGCVGSPCNFTVETNGAVGALGFSIEGPSEAEIKCVDNGDGSCEVAYFPTAPGEYAIHITCDDEDIVHSPYMAQISPNPGGFDASKVKAYGKGVEKNGPKLGQPVDFIIDTKAAGKAPVKVTVTDQYSNEVPVDVKDNGDGTFKCTYTAPRPVKHSVSVTYGSIAIPNSPFRVEIEGGADKVKVYGPGIEPNKVVSTETTYFTIDVKEAGGPGPIHVAVKSAPGVNGKGEKEIKSTVKDNGDGTYKVQYTPENPGKYAIAIGYHGKPVPQSPIYLDVQPKIDLSKVYVDGLETRVFLDSPTDFTVDAKPIGGLPKDALKCAVTNPAGQVTEPLIKDNKDGTYNVSYTPTEEGPHKVDVKVAGKPIGKSPYNVGVVEGSDATKCKAYGPGLEGGNTNKPCKFTVETKGAGTGGLGLAIEGPSEAKMTCVDNKDGTCSVEYWPTKPGDYEVQIKFADQHIPGSPFHAAVKDVVDHTKVKASGPGLERAGVRAGAPATFTVDATKAGVAPLDVTVIPEKGPKEKPLIKDNGDGTFECTYMPQTEGKCDVEVKYADKQIPQSPFHTKILPSHDASKVKVQGPGLEKTGIPASLPIEFIVDTRDAGDAELTITITDANGKHIKPDIIDNGDGTYRIRYTPTDVGRYTITVKYGGDQVPYSPYHVRTSPTGDASKVEIIGVKCGDVDIPIVRRMSTDTEGSVSSYASTSTTTTTTTTTRETITKTVTVHEETVIKVNSRDAGKGRVTATVTAPDGTDVGDVKVIDNGDGTFDIVWTCPATGRYTLDIKFGGVAITGGPFKVVAEEGPPRTDIDSMSQDMRPFDLVIPVTGAGTGKITGEVKTPSGKRHKPQITENKDGTIKVKYSPTEKGLHILYIKYNDKDVPGSPFEFHVVEVKSGQVTAYGPGLTHGVVCEPCNFTINTKDAGAGGLALAVEGPSKAEIKCIDNKDGTCSVSYYPTKPGDYSVIVKFADKHVPGSPFNAKITDGPMRHLPLGRSSEVPLRINETDLSQLTATIKSPSSTKDEPCQLKRLPNGNIGISFTPKETGDHMVSVKKRGLHVTNSPFKVTVGPQEIGDASKVKVSGLGIAEADAGEIAEFLVDTTKAGYGGLGVSIEGPSKADINCEDNGDGTCTVTYRPTEPGNYILNVKYADQHVPGSPFKVKVHGEGSGKFVETITRKRQAAAVSQVGSECELGMKIPGTDPLDMTAQVTNPAGKTEDAEIVDGSAFTYTVRFVPNMMGVHTVSVKHKGMHVAGSPFQFTVGPLGEGGAHKVHAGGPGLERGEVKQKSEFTVWTREAGPGSLSISVEGPAKAEIDFEDKKDGSCQVCYEPTEPGEYAVSIKYNDEHIPDSPYKVFVTPPIGDARRLSVTSLQETGLKPNQPASFAVQLNGAQGLIDAKVVAPSGTEDDCIITEISEGNYAVRFMPRENGVHMIHVRFKGAHIPGSPFRVRVGSVEGDPGMVHATGPGLESARTGEKTHFIVNTCGAGAGAMAITIDGPSKVKMDVEEVPEGYKCMYTPMAPGDYFITIKYAGAHHIVGSPFKVKVTGANKAGVTGVHESSQMVVETVTKTTTTTNYASMPTFTSDASKVTSTGMGLKKAFINRKAQFTVNASDAGNNMLTVGIAGPKTPCEEILVKHNGRNRYIINYILKEKGNYVMIVKWGNDHIPGSPFQLVCS